MPAPKPLTLHRLDGTFRRDRHQTKPRKPIVPPRPPTWLSPVAKAEWKRVTRDLARLGIIHPVLDVTILACYCSTYSLWRDATAQVTAEGMTYKTDAGLVKRHPGVAIAAQAARDLLSFGAELGLSPISRTKLRVDEGAALDPDDDFLDGKKRFFRH